MTQEKERLEAEEKAIERELKRNQQLIDRQRLQIEPILRRLYDSMGFSEDPISIQTVLLHPQDAKERLDTVINPGAIAPLSDAIVQSQLKLQGELSSKTLALRRLQRKSGAINGHLKQEEKFSANSNVSPIQQTENKGSGLAENKGSGLAFCNHSTHCRIMASKMYGNFIHCVTTRLIRGNNSIIYTGIAFLIFQ